MQLILDCFKRIFEALAGVYTKAETDSALATKADATALEAEAQAREESISAEASRVDTRLAEHDAEIDTLQKVTAGLGEGATAAANVAKWQTYATAIQKDLDSETAMQLAQEFSRATDEYLADPIATKTWVTTSETASTNPYFSEAPTKPVVDFRVSKAAGNSTKSSFNYYTDTIIFLPLASDVNYAVFNTKFTSHFFAPCATLWVATFSFSGYNAPIVAEKAFNISYIANQARSFDSYAYIPNCNTAVEAFAKTAISPSNVAKTLDSLPRKTDGTSHVIKFSRADGTLLAPLMAVSPYKESVDAAVARGWTVQFD